MVVVILQSFLAQQADAQFISRLSQSNEFFFDAIVFKSPDSAAGRIDIYTVIPYSSLEFRKSGDYYGAQFDIIFQVSDSSGKKIQSNNIERTLTENDYFKSQGGDASFEPVSVSFTLPKGRYDVIAMVSDRYSKKEYSRSRVVNVLDFDSYDFSLSGILLVSSIEKTDEKYKITPHINDNVGTLKDGFFAFFESYSKSARDSIGLIYEITTEGNELVSRSEYKPTAITKGTQQHYLRVILPPDTKSGSYVLNIIALKESSTSTANSNLPIAAAQRSIKVFRTIADAIVIDFDKAVRQLRYVANGDEMDFINSAKTIDEKTKRFEQFWEKRDPTPRTTRNEAFDEYYLRITYANQNFGGYSEGWLTDKGMVFIIFGKPMNIERGTPYNDGRVYERWTYSSNREFLFIDNSGFGDFRLVSPRLVSEKYEYNK